MPLCKKKTIQSLWTRDDFLFFAFAISRPERALNHLHITQWFESGSERAFLLGHRSKITPKAIHPKFSKKDALNW